MHSPLPSFLRCDARGLRSAVLAGVSLWGVLAWAQSLPKESPFLPAAGASGTASAGPASFEFVGMTALGEQTLIGITRQQDKRSFWIPVGKTSGEITAVSYDARTDTAVIRADGQTLSLKLRKGGVLPGLAAAMPPPPPMPVTPAATPVVVPTRPLSVQEEKEMEARMLVTDLLEIGQQQRKAYEEAQRQAAARAKAGQPPLPPAPRPAAPAPAAGASSDRR